MRICRIADEFRRKRATECACAGSKCNIEHYLEVVRRARRDLQDRRENRAVIARDYLAVGAVEDETVGVARYRLAHRRVGVGVDVEVLYRRSAGNCAVGAGSHINGELVEPDTVRIASVACSDAEAVYRLGRAGYERAKARTRATAVLSDGRNIAEYADARAVGVSGRPLVYGRARRLADRASAGRVIAVVLDLKQEAVGRGCLSGADARKIAFDCDDLVDVGRSRCRGAVSHLEGHAVEFLVLVGAVETDYVEQ